MNHQDFTIFCTNVKKTLSQIQYNNEYISQTLMATDCYKDASDKKIDSKVTSLLAVLHNNLFDLQNTDLMVLTDGLSSNSKIFVERLFNSFKLQDLDVPIAGEEEEESDIVAYSKDNRNDLRNTIYWAIDHLSVTMFAGHSIKALTALRAPKFITEHDLVQKIFEPDSDGISVFFLICMIGNSETLINKLLKKYFVEENEALIKKSLNCMVSLEHPLRGVSPLFCLSRKTVSKNNVFFINDMYLVNLIAKETLNKIIDSRIFSTESALYWMVRRFHTTLQSQYDDNGEDSLEEKKHDLMNNLFGSTENSIDSNALNQLIHSRPRRGESALLWFVRGCSAATCLKKHINQLRIDKATFNQIVEDGSRIGESVALHMIAVTDADERIILFREFITESLRTDNDYLSEETLNHIIPRSNREYRFQTVAFTFLISLFMRQPDYDHLFSIIAPKIDSQAIQVVINNPDLYHCMHGESLRSNSSGVLWLLLWNQFDAREHEVFLQSMSTDVLNALWESLIQDGAILNVLALIVFSLHDNDFNSILNSNIANEIFAAMDMHSLKILLRLFVQKDYTLKNDDPNIDLNEHYFSRLKMFIARFLEVNPDKLLSLIVSKDAEDDLLVRKYLLSQNDSDHYICDNTRYQSTSRENLHNALPILGCSNQQLHMFSLLSARHAPRTGTNSAARKLPPEVLRDHLSPMLG